MSSTLKNRRGNSSTPSSPPTFPNDSDAVRRKGGSDRDAVPGTFQSAVDYLFEEQDAAYLAIFRILWGTIMFYEAFSYISFDFMKMRYLFYSSPLRFAYYGFEWVTVPEHPDMLKLVFIVMSIAALGITMGFFYRLSSILYFVLFSYHYLLDQAMYLNHFYLVCILSFMMILLPCNTLFSLDVFLFPEIKKETAPRWCLFLVRTELVIVYTFAGFVKFNEDWLRAQPLREWLGGRETIPLVGRFISMELTAWLFSYTGMIYDSIVGFLLIYKPTLYLAVFLSLIFHITNKIIFNIGIFPWMMIASTTFFFDPSWPRGLLRLDPLPIVIKQRNRALSLSEKLLLAFVVIFLLHQLLVPLRYTLYPGNVAWTEHGHKFSWRMKLRTKVCHTNFFGFQPVETTAFPVPLKKVIPGRFINKMCGRPELIVQAAHYLADLYTKNGTRPEIYCHMKTSLNDRRWQDYVNSTVDLASQPAFQEPCDWIIPLLPLTPEEESEFPWNWDWDWESLSHRLLRPLRSEPYRNINKESTDNEALESFRRFIRKKVNRERKIDNKETHE